MRATDITDSLVEAKDSSYDMVAIAAKVGTAAGIFDRYIVEKLKAAIEKKARDMKNLEFNYADYDRGYDEEGNIGGKFYVIDYVNEGPDVTKSIDVHLDRFDKGPFSAIKVASWVFQFGIRWADENTPDEGWSGYALLPGVDEFQKVVVAVANDLLEKNRDEFIRERGDGSALLYYDRKVEAALNKMVALWAAEIGKKMVYWNDRLEKEGPATAKTPSPGQKSLKIEDTEPAGGLEALLRMLEPVEEMTACASEIFAMFKGVAGKWVAELNDILGGGYRQKDAMPGPHGATYWLASDRKGGEPPMLVSIEIVKDDGDEAEENAEGGMYDMTVQLVEPKRRTVVVTSPIRGVPSESFGNPRKLLDGFRQQYARYAASSGGEKRQAVGEAFAGSEYRKWLCKTLSVREADLGDAYKVEEAITKAVFEREEHENRAHRVGLVEQIFEHLKEWYDKDGEDSVIRQVVSGFVQAVSKFPKGTLFDNGSDWVKWGKDLLKTLDESTDDNEFLVWSPESKTLLKAYRDAEAAVASAAAQLTAHKKGVLKILAKRGWEGLRPEDVIINNDGSVTINGDTVQSPVEIDEKEAGSMGVNAARYLKLFATWLGLWDARDTASAAYFSAVRNRPKGGK